MPKAPTSGFGQFVAEMRRRRVGRFALGYAASAFVVLQLAEIVFPAFGFGESGLRILVVVTALGFPPALVLAWVYDLTTDGIRRTEEGDVVNPVLPGLALGALLIATVGVTGALGLYLARQGVFDDNAAEPAPLATAVRMASYDPAAPIRSIAVLPLDDFSPDAGQAYFTASMHEELIAKLSMLEAVRVVSRTSVMQYAGTTLTIPTIGRELGVDVVIEGSVSRTPERTRVTLQLIHAPSDSHIKTLQWDRAEVPDVLAFQTEIAHAVVEEFNSDHREVDFAQTATNVDPAALDAFFRGRFEFDRGTPEGYRMAVEYFQDALREDPDFAQAMAGLAGARFLIGIEDEMSAEEMGRAHSEAHAALELDSTSVAALDVLASIERGMRRLMGEDPVIPAPTDAPKATHVISIPGERDSVTINMEAFDTAWVTAATSLGRRIESQVRRRSTVVEGEDGARETFAARQLLASGRYTEAARELEEVVAETPEAGAAWDMLARAKIATGEPREAVRVIERWNRSGAAGAPTDQQLVNLRDAMATDGLRGYWAWVLERNEELEAEGVPVPRMTLASAHAALGHSDQAFAYLVEALENGEPGVLGIRSDPVWDRLRGDPRFREIGRQAQIMRFSSGRRDRRGRGGS